MHDVAGDAEAQVIKLTVQILWAGETVHEFQLHLEPCTHQLHPDQHCDDELQFIQSKIFYLLAHPICTQGQMFSKLRPVEGVSGLRRQLGEVSQHSANYGA